MEVMKAFFLDENNELAVVTRPTPTPKAGEVLVKVKAAALNHRDIWITKGLYPKIQLPTILGSDGAGTVTAIGSGVDEGWLNQAIISYPAYNWGDKLHTSSPEFRLIGMPDPGFIAEYITLPVENLLKKPEYLSWEQAAAIPVATLTAWRGLVTQGRVQAGDNVLITGIGGGVAQAGLALAVRHDANVYVTSSSPTKIAFARAHGAVEGFDYRAGRLGTGTQGYLRWH